jgi:hypothetical protein
MSIATSDFEAVRGTLGIPAWRGGRIWHDKVCRHSRGKKEIRGLTKRKKSEIITADAFA